MPNVFALSVFFIIFRESVETAIIVSMLLALVKKSMGPENDPVVYKKLVRQIWLGTLTGLLICICIGAGVIGAFHRVGRLEWHDGEKIWEGFFAFLASVIITMVGAAQLRIAKFQKKWTRSLQKSLERNPSETDTRTFKQRFKRFSEKYAMFMLPFVTVLREGIEAVIFAAGVGLGLPVSSLPLAVACGLAAGAACGFVIYKGLKLVNLQIFLIAATCFLYLVAAGLFSKAAWAFGADNWNGMMLGDAAEAGAGPGSYDIRQSVWHVNCCSPDVNGGGGWGVFNAIFGWQNSATYASVITYNLYWLIVMVWFFSMRRREKKGKNPFGLNEISNGSDTATLNSRSQLHRSANSIALSDFRRLGLI